MKKSSMYLLGMIVGIVICKVSTTPISWESIIYLSVFSVVISIDNLNKWVFFFMGLSYIIYEPIRWCNGGTIHWYQPILFLYVLSCLLYNFFPKKRDKPLFVDYGDITRFPVETVKDNSIIEPSGFNYISNQHLKK